MNYFLPNPKGDLSENSIAFFPLNTLHPSRNNTQEPLKIYEMEVSLIVWAQECFIWFMDSAASLATQAKIVQVVNYRDAWNYRLGGTRSQRFQGKVQDAVKTSQKKTFPLHGKFLDVHISLGCWFVSWNILSRERRRGKGILTLSSKGKPRAQTSISNISSKIISWFTSGGKKADLCCLCREKELNPKWHTLETCSSWSATASCSDLYPATLHLQGKLPVVGHGKLFSSFPHFSHFPRATCTKFKLKSPEKGRAALLSSSFALVLWHNLCSGSDFPVRLRTEAAHVNVSQTHTWMFLPSKDVTKKPITSGPPKTDRAVYVINIGERSLCGQLLPKTDSLQDPGQSYQESRATALL